MLTLSSELQLLGDELKGELRTDPISKTIYSTDASVYKETPEAVVWPADDNDLKKLIKFASQKKIPIIVRGAGTSLAGQVVGKGIIADISRHMNRVLEINEKEKWVRVQPGVVLDELNKTLKSTGLFFGPETSTASRCNIGGMVGNNACGLHSLIYGSTRDHTLELKALLSDGSEAVFGDLDRKGFEEKCQLESLEGNIYRNIREILSDKKNTDRISSEFPDPSVPRRNTGYALDLLMNSSLFTENSDTPFNFSKILCGSEGTLAIITEIKLKLIPLPPVNKALVCIHLKERNDAFRANLIALKYNPSAVEMMDEHILSLTKDNISQRKNRFFVEGDPGSILIVEFNRNSPEEIDNSIASMVTDLQSNDYGYAFPVLKGKDITKAWELRKAGLGVLSNMKGDAKPVTLIEDTAISVSVLPEYMEEIGKMLMGYGKDSVYHAHIGTGELHVRPVLNLKDKTDVELFRTIGAETAKIVKKYRGSLSGEHGDGRLRGEFIPLVIGEDNYQLIRKIKFCWDPENLFNPGKIVDAVGMDRFLRYEPGQSTIDLPTYFDFTSTDGMMRAAENCNGSGDCRKSEIIGGLMCPSFMGTRDEKTTTRARANVLREFLGKKGEDPWNHREIYEILDLCLSCKGCKSECPSNVDMAKMKSEYLQHWYDKNGVPLRVLLIAWFPAINRLGSFIPGIYNFFVSNKLISKTIKRISGFAQERSVPLIYKTTLRRWIRKNRDKLRPADPRGRICLFVDEFTNYNDTGAGIKMVKLFSALGYEVVTIDHEISTRTFISKGLLRKAGQKARKNISLFSRIITKEFPLVGLEPSALLAFRDEYPDLAGPDLALEARTLSANCYLADEFLAKEFREGRISRDSFTDEARSVLLHTHCQQKAVASSASLLEALSIPSGFRVREIPSGCCGMAGSFGFEKEHFELSNKIGELVLFPEVRAASSDTIIAAPGTSCRHHIKDGTGRIALHPMEVLYDALKK